MQSQANSQTRASAPTFPLHRPELALDLEMGDEKLGELLTRRHSVEPRRTICTAGATVGLVHRIRSGWCARQRLLPDGRLQITALLLPGDLCGEDAIFRTAQSDELVAITRVELDGVDPGLLMRRARDDRQVMLRLAFEFAEKERRNQNWLLALSQGRAEERLALLFVDIRARLELAGLIGSQENEFPWPLTQQDMAHATGLTAVHVNRVVKHLRALGLVAVAQRRARIGRQGLFALAQPLLDLYERHLPAFGAGPGRLSWRSIPEAE